MIRSIEYEIMCYVCALMFIVQKLSIQARKSIILLIRKHLK